MEKYFSASFWPDEREIFPDYNPPVDDVLNAPGVPHTGLGQISLSISHVRNEQIWIFYGCLPQWSFGVCWKFWVIIDFRFPCYDRKSFVSLSFEFSNQFLPFLHNFTKYEIQEVKRFIGAGAMSVLLIDLTGKLFYW